MLRRRYVVAWQVHWEKKWEKNDTYASSFIPRKHTINPIDNLDIGSTDFSSQ